MFGKLIKIGGGIAILTLAALGALALAARTDDDENSETDKTTAPKNNSKAAEGPTSR